MDAMPVSPPKIGPKDPPFQVSTPGSLRSLLLDGSVPVLLLGAGASVTSGIPAAASAAEKAVRWAWCREAGLSPEDMRVTRSDYWPWLSAQPWFSEKLNLADQYPTIVEKLLGVRKLRRDFFEKIIAPGVSPNQGYRALARILNEGWISTVLTTNFDHCLEDAKVLENKPHYLVSIKTADDLVRFSASSAEPQLIYLHGSVEHYSDKNLNYEVQELDQRLVNRIAPVLRDHPVIVVGYRGSERSIMQGLFLDSCDVTNSFAQGVYWCVRDSDASQPLSPLVQDLGRKIGNNFQIVPIGGFDELLKRDLWDPLLAGGALPIRRARGYRPVDVPFDMRPVTGVLVSDLDQKTLASRLTQYAKRLGFGAPDDPSASWLNQEALSRNLATDDDTISRPTFAGWLLFANHPQNITKHAVVAFTARGPAHWIRRCFGDDAIPPDSDDKNPVTVEQEISGNLWAQLTALTDLLALINTGFRLKDALSRTAYPYDSLALKEIIVNALVHRDYERSDPVKIVVTPERIQVASPGGIIAEVANQVSGNDLQAAVQSGSRGIKGYRNPVITDLFYGGGQMDRSGSGLADVWTLTVNNNGDVQFGPDTSNTNFVVTIFSRPEAVDEITNTALPLITDTVRYTTNILPIDEMPLAVWHAGCTARSAFALRRETMGLAVPPGYVQDGRLFTLYDLEQMVENLVTPFEQGDVEKIRIPELLSLPNGENILLKLLNDAMFEHLRSLGLQIDYKNRRAYFPREDAGERKVTYRGRVKRATRTVVKARKRRGTDDIIYYEHKAFGFTVMSFGESWSVLITPGYSFTRDGVKDPIGRQRINVLSTKRAARDFNPTVGHDVTFWAAVLSNEADGVFPLLNETENDLAKYAPKLLLSSRQPTVAFNAAAVFGRDGVDDELDADFEDLDEEITKLAKEESDSDDEGDKDDD
jgi:NAD-dependent SIR2 family protein deacetylase